MKSTTYVDRYDLTSEPLLLESRISKSQDSRAHSCARRFSCLRMVDGAAIGHRLDFALIGG
jgi:hypothetical protein